MRLILLVTNHQHTQMLPTKFGENPHTHVREIAIFEFFAQKLWLKKSQFFVRLEKNARPHFEPPQIQEKKAKPEIFRGFVQSNKPKMVKLTVSERRRLAVDAQVVGLSSPELIEK